VGRRRLCVSLEVTPGPRPEPASLSRRSPAAGEWEAKKQGRGQAWPPCHFGFYLSSCHRKKASGLPLRRKAAVSGSMEGRGAVRGLGREFGTLGTVLSRRGGCSTRWGRGRPESLTVMSGPERTRQKLSRARGLGATIDEGRCGAGRTSVPRWRRLEHRGNSSMSRDTDFRAWRPKLGAKATRSGVDRAIEPGLINDSEGIQFERSHVDHVAPSVMRRLCITRPVHGASIGERLS